MQVDFATMCCFSQEIKKTTQNFNFVWRIRGLLNTNWPVNAKTMTSPGKSTPPGENAWDSCAKFNYVVGSAQAPLYLELRAGLQSLTEHTHLKSRNQEFFAMGPWEGKNNATLKTLVYPKESGKKISKSSTQGAAKEARDHTIIDRSCMFCTVWETFSHNLGLNHNLGMGFRRDFKTDLSRERAQLRDGGVTNCGQFGKISARALSLFLSWTEFIVSVVLQM